MTLTSPISSCGGASRPAGPPIESVEARSSVDGSSTVFNASSSSQQAAHAPDTPHAPEVPAWLEALDCLRSVPVSLHQAHERVRKFSERRGCLAQTRGYVQSKSSSPTGVWLPYGADAVTGESPGSQAGVPANLSGPNGRSAGSRTEAANGPQPSDSLPFPLLSEHQTSRNVGASTLFARPRPPRRFELVDAYRYWADPIASTIPRVKGPLPDSLPIGADGWRLGGVALSVSECIASLYEAKQQNAQSKARPCTARLYSRVGGFSEAGAWHAALAELAQELYLTDLFKILPQFEETAFNKNTARWPNLSDPTLMCLEHGLGVPVMQINSHRTAVGFLDVTPASLIGLERRLLYKWLLIESRPETAKWTNEQLDAVLTPALADWVRSLRQEVKSSDSGLFASWFRFLEEQSSVHGSLSQSSCDLMDKLSAEVGKMKKVDQKNPGDAALVRGVEDSAVFRRVVDGLVTLQDKIRYGGGSLPSAGAERAYLNSLMRNFTCDALGFSCAAELAQFDLLLRAARRARNHGFNDHSVNQALEQHHAWVAETQGGCDTPLRQSLLSLTDAYKEALEQPANDCMFTLDEPSRATANRCRLAFDRTCRASMSFNAH